MISATPVITVLSLFVLPVHCIIMCGPNYLIKNKNAKGLYLLGRFISYSLVGGIFGYFGQGLFSLLEYETLKFLSFFMFLVVSLLIFSAWLGVSFKFVPQWFGVQLKKSMQLPSFFQGLLSVGLPCSTIYQMVGFSILTKSFYGGLIIGSAYSFVTGLFLWLGTHFGIFLQSKMKGVAVAFKVLMACMILFSLMQLTIKVWMPNFSENLSPAQKALFCL